MLLQLSSKQEAAIKAGELKRKRLIRATKQAANQFKLDEDPVHYYIYGPSGIGKTYNTEKAIEETGLDYLKLSGNISMYNFAIKLGVIAYQNLGKRVIVVIDDCDEILKDAKNINIMKEVLGEERRLSYSKRFHLNSVGEEGDPVYTAMEYWLDSNGVGFTIDLSNITFIITSNIRLPYDDTSEALKKQVVTEGVVQRLDTSASILARHLSAIRGRCEVKDLDMSMEEKWGNLASVCLQDGACKDCRDDQEKIFILDYIWNNWRNMKETSIRTAEKMARTLKLEGADGIKDAFDADYLK